MASSPGARAGGGLPRDRLGGQTVAVWMMLLTDWMTMAGMDVPLEAPTAMDVAVVLSQPEEKSSGERCDQRDVGERPAHKVVTAARGPVDHVMKAADEEHARPRLTSDAAGIGLFPGDSAGSRDTLRAWRTTS